MPEHRAAPDGDSRIRVLVMIRDVGPGYGGAEMVAFELARRLDPQRFEASMCVTRAPTPSRREISARSASLLRDQGVEVLRLERGSSWSLRPWVRLYRFLRRRRIDVLHSHMFRSNLPGAVIARLARVPVVVSHEHTWSFRGRPLRRLADRAVIAPLSDVIVAVSSGDRDRMVEFEGIPAERIRVVPNGLPDRPPAGDTDLRAELGLGAGAPLVGALGRLQPQKALHVLVEAAALLRRDFPDVRVVLAGEGTERPRLEALIAERGLGDTVSLLGHRTDPMGVLACLDVAVLCSEYEGSPLALIEYMAAGKPIVVTDVRGMSDLVRDGEHALLVEPDSPPALAAGIRRLLEDRELAQSLGREARARQRAELTIEAMVRRFEELYAELYEAARTRGEAARDRR